MFHSISTNTSAFQHWSEQENKKRLHCVGCLGEEKVSSDGEGIQDILIFPSKVFSRNSEPVYYLELSDQPVIKITVSHVWPLVIRLLD